MVKVWNKKKINKYKNRIIISKKEINENKENSKKENKPNNKKTTLIMSLLVITIFTIIFTSSYAFFTTTVTSKEFVVYTGALAVDYKKKTDVINLNNLYPMTNSQGLELTAHEFVVENTGNIDARYQIRLELSEDNMIPTKYIKVSLKENDNEYSEPVLLSDLNSSLVILSNKVINPTKSNDYGIKLWIDINAPNDIQGKTFKARIVVDSIQNVEEGYVVNTNPIIYMNEYENGNTDIILNKGETYKELGIEKVTDDQDILTPNDVTTTYQKSDGTIVENIDTSKSDIYYVKYSVTDSSNNKSIVTRVVAIKDKNLKIYSDIDSVVSSFNESELQEVIMCTTIESGENKLYLDCKIHDTIENALASKTKGTIILTRDIERSSFINIKEDKNITLELNEKNIKSENSRVLTVYGKLNLLNSTAVQGVITSTETVIATGSTASLDISNVKIISTNTDNASAICNGGKLIINEGTYIEGVYGIGCHNSNSALTIVNGGTIIGYSQQGIQLNSGSAGTAIINNGYIKGKSLGLANAGTGNVTINNGNIIGENGIAIYNASTGIINIYAGVIVSENNKTIVNNSTGVININQVDKPLYINSLAQIWNPAVNNTNSGIININGIKADNCTNNSEDTTNGLCIYAEGDKNYESNTSNTAVANSGQNGGVININGGTMFGGYIGVSNHYTGIINIKGGNIQSGNLAISNMREANTNICGGKISSLQYDLWAASSSTGLINYSSNVVFTSGNNTPTIGGITNNIISNYTGTCSN